LSKRVNCETLTILNNVPKACPEPFGSPALRAGASVAQDKLREGNRPQGRFEVPICKFYTSGLILAMAVWRELRFSSQNQNFSAGIKIFQPGIKH
jgi:hypothetical protein